MSNVQLKTVTADEDGMRLDRWFKAHYPDLRHGELEKLLRKGQIRVEGGRVKSNRRLSSGETVRVPPVPKSDQQRSANKQYASPREAETLREMIVFEDEALLAINKPFGLPVQGGAQAKHHVDGMLGSLGDKDNRPRLVHRLDKDTGGLLLVAKTRKAAQKLSDAFKKHTVEKTYWALTAGSPRPREGTISLPIAKKMMRIEGRDMERVAPFEGEGAKKAISHYQILDEAGHIAFVAMRPITGRTHQLRVHASAIGCPIVGDGKYGGQAARIEGVSQKLHLFCRTMTFRHPATGRVMTLSAPLGGHMAESWDFFSFDKAAVCEWPEDVM